ncbi:MAG: polyribonucleotide nucleotidyltransferase [Chlorobi bacterium]|nr:polyribonucleotide nucleotidyltransferase [Chlorobiota bacterium]MCI0716517.1 polyribonucleotide nucleotidyltransferase [Chlorobiota bacterium]
MVTFKEIELGGRKLRLETGRLARQASGAVLASYGDTIVLCTVVASEEPKEDIDYFPLQVEYREKSAAVGKIPGGFFKREGKPSEKEVLSARLIDRPIRPLFPEEFMCETQVICGVYSSDQENDADVIAALGASAALMVSDIPFDGPIGEVRVGRINGEFIVNPTHTQLKESDMDLIVGGTEDSIVMVEGESAEISESDLLNAIKFAHENIKLLCAVQKELASECGKAKREVKPAEVNQELIADVKSLAEGAIKEIHRMPNITKDERSGKYKALFESITESLKEKYPEREKAIAKAFDDIQYYDMREMILTEGRRLDGRGTKDIRPITCEVGILPRNHGSALFTRGETQSLTSVTLGTKMDQQILDGLLPEENKRFMLHYNFPPFSTGETGRYGNPGRREVGHGHLAERSLENMLPPEEDFPYTIRIVSDILESNGSSSMATVCAGTLALMDGGVKIKRPVAGIAMGLIKESDRVAVLSDILGNEDFLGDMDFKVCGTTEGITGFQMDIKIKGVSFEVLETALQQAKEGRMHILDVMRGAIAEPRENISPYAPHLYTMTVPIDMIGAVIGPGGKNIRHIIEESGAEINIEDDGTVVIAAVSGESARIAQSMIAKITEVPEKGKIYKGKVVKTTDFGAFVEILPGKEGLLHISQIDKKRVNKVEDVLRRGDMVTVKVLEIDRETGKLSLSRKVLLDDEGKEKKEAVKSE